MANILIFGDSISHGAWDIEGGWVQRIRKFLDKNYEDYLIYNLGVFGNDTNDLLKRFEFETKQRIKEEIKEEKEIIFIFAIGVNDSQFIHSQNNLRVFPEKFKENIQKLISFAQKFSSKIIFIGLIPVEETKTTPIPWNTDKSCKNEHIQKYNKIIKTVCDENKIHFIELFDKLKKIKYQELLQDGLHPNSKGHQKIFETVGDFLIENKII